MCVCVCLSLGQLNKEDTKKKTRRSSEKDTPTARGLLLLLSELVLNQSVDVTEKLHIRHPCDASILD